MEEVIEGEVAVGERSKDQEEEEEETKEDEKELEGIENFQTIQIRTEQEEQRVQELYYLVTKKTAIGVWQPSLRLVEVVKIKGNFWKKVGFSMQSKNYLYPEEALYLFEKRQLAISLTIEEANSQMFLKKEEIFKLFYKENGMDLGIFLAYCKFKSLGYIPFRRKTMGRVVQDEIEVAGLLARNPFRSLLDLTIMYEVYQENESFSKAAAKKNPPIAYALLTDGEHMFSFSFLTALLQEAKGIHLIVAIISPNGIVSLVEFADAEKALDLYNTEEKIPVISRKLGESSTTGIGP